MNRRKFLRHGSLAGFTLPTLIGATAKAGNNTTETLSDFALKDNELNEVTVDELQQKMQSGDLSSKAITKWYLKRIEDVDKTGPAINTFLRWVQQSLLYCNLNLKMV